MRRTLILCVLVVSAAARHVRHHTDLAAAEDSESVGRRDLEGEEAPKKKLRLLFDMNQTIMLADAVKKMSPEKAIANFPVFAPAKKLLGDKYGSVLEYLKDEKDGDHDSECKVPRGGPETTCRAHFKHLVKLEKDEKDPDTGLLTSFKNAIDWLRDQSEYDWSLVLMTYGQDIPSVAQTVAAWVKGTTVKDTEPADLASLSGQWVRWGVGPEETSLSMLTTDGIIASEIGFGYIDALLNGRLGSGCVSQDDLKNGKAERNGRPICRENNYEGGNRVLFTRNHNDVWRVDHNRDTSWGKVVLQGPKEDNVLTIMFDDGIKLKPPRPIENTKQFYDARRAATSMLHDNHASIACLWVRDEHDGPWRPVPSGAEEAKPHLIPVSAEDALTKKEYFQGLIKEAAQQYWETAEA